MRSNVLQPAAVALAAACIAVPLCVPAAQVAAKDAAPVLEQHSAALPVSLPVTLSASTTDLLGSLGLPLEAALWILAANPTGATPAATNVPPLPASLAALTPYASVYTVLNAAIKIVSAPAADITTGQWDKAGADAQAAITAFQAVWSNFPTSVTATIQYVMDALAGAMAAPATLAKATDSTATVTALAQAPAAAPGVSGVLDAASLLVKVPLWLTAANPTGATPAATNVPPLPASLAALTPYASVFTVLNAAIKIVSAPATDLTTGQWDKIIADTQSAFTAFQTVAGNFPTTVAATLQYASDQIAADLGGAPATVAATPAVQRLAIASTAADTDTDTTVDTDTVVATKTASPKTLKAAAAETPKPHVGFLKKLQSAVDSEVGGGKVAVSAPQTAKGDDSPQSGGAGAPSTGTSTGGKHRATTKPASRTSDAKSSASAGAK
ncbi:MAG: hypothetical protein ABWY93_06160 [Mycobacterium sp.]